jgi:hypothetical protein
VNFLRPMEREDLRTRIFLTDADFEELFGPRVSRLVSIMNMAARNVCPSCNGYCCKNIGCLFYSEYFGACPIFDRRPRECRYHFCNEVFQAAPLTRDEKDMMQQPIEELICGGRGEIARLFHLFPEFPLDEKGLESLGMRDSVEIIKRYFEEGKLGEECAFSRLKALCKA